MARIEIFSNSRPWLA